ncbi:MAG: dihydroorotase [Armatimonadetes bacterium]|nr:dihydroorotase [Armatimonadota bacterium]
MSVQYDLVITDVEIVSPTGTAVGNIAINGQTIAAVGDVSESEGRRLLKGSGLTAIPGVIDTQVHFREPGMTHKEDLESGTRAAVVGGTTTIFEMPNTNPTTTTEAALKDKLRRAEGRAWCDYSFFFGATTENAELLASAEKLPGSPGIKIFMGSSTGSLLVSDDEDVRRVLKHGKRPVAVHSEHEPRLRERKALISANPHPREHPFLRDAESARLCTERLLRLSAETQRPVHILHISTADELPLIREAKDKGLNNTAEVTPQHLWFNADDYERLGSLLQMNPPIRSKDHQEALWKALDADLFDVFGSDHAPHTLDEKAKPYPESPSGMPGVQTMLAALLTFVHQGRLSMEKLVRMACANPAKLYGIKNKGSIAPGFDADLVLIDRKASYQFTRNLVESKCGWSPYEGETFYGSIEHVFLRGNWMLRDGGLQHHAVGQPVTFDWK